LQPEAAAAMGAVAEVALREAARREAAEAVQCEAAEAVQFEAVEAAEVSASAAAEAAGPAGFGRLWAGSLSADNGRTQADENTIIHDVRFTPESGHFAVYSRCPLSAKSGHSSLRSRALAYSLNGYHVVSRQWAANALERKIADRFDCYVLLDCHQDARTN
jgi:hypothetical protein